MLAIICIILGIVAFLVMVHPGVFWLVFLPLGLILIALSTKFLKSSNTGITTFIAIMIVLIAMVIAILAVCIP